MSNAGMMHSDPIVHEWISAAYESDLRPSPRLLAYVYADLARDGHAAVSISTLMARTGLAFASITTNRKILVDKGWLVKVHSGTGHQPDLYALAIPNRTSTIEADGAR